MAEEKPNPIFILQSFVNSFAYLYGDAEYLYYVAKTNEKNFETVQLCRTALLLYILSLEGLINRALDHFLPEHIHDFVVEREEKFRLEDKWLLLPLLATEEQKAQFDKSNYPWSHFAELVRIRNDFVHPKHDRPAYYRAIASHNWTPLSWKEIPRKSGIKETELVYRQTQIPKDPYAVRLNHIETAKRVVDDTIAELDKLLDGKISKDNWLKSDQMELIYPAGAKLDDLRILDQSEPKKKSDN